MRTELIILMLVILFLIFYVFGFLSQPEAAPAEPQRTTYVYQTPVYPSTWFGGWGRRWFGGGGRRWFGGGGRRWRH